MKMRGDPVAKIPKRTQKQTPTRTRKAPPTQAPSPVVQAVTSGTAQDVGALDVRLAKSLARFGGALPVLADSEPQDEKFGKQKSQALQIIALRVQGLTIKDAAEALGINFEYARQLSYLAGKHGWFTPVDPAERLEFNLSHKIVRNTEELLDHPHPMIRMEMTKEAARGIGLFKQHAVNKDEGRAGPMVLAIKIEMPNPNGAGVPQMREGAAGGKPLFIEGEVTHG